MDTSPKKLAPFILLFLVFTGIYFRNNSLSQFDYSNFILIFGIGFSTAMMLKTLIDLNKKKN